MDAVPRRSPKTGQREGARDIDSGGGKLRHCDNVLSEDKQKQVVALGQLGWPLRRIEKETGIRRETAAGYLKAAGIAVRPPTVRATYPEANLHAFRATYA
jgi:hypothetical protein